MCKWHFGGKTQINSYMNKKPRNIHSQWDWEFLSNWTNWAGAAPQFSVHSLNWNQRFNLISIPAQQLHSVKPAWGFALQLYLPERIWYSYFTCLFFNKPSIPVLLSRKKKGGFWQGTHLDWNSQQCWGGVKQCGSSCCVSLPAEFSSLLPSAAIGNSQRKSGMSWARASHLDGPAEGTIPVDIQLPRQISAQPSRDWMNSRIFGVSPVFHHTTGQNKQEECWENTVGITQDVPKDPKLLQINPRHLRSRGKRFPSKWRRRRRLWKAFNSDVPEHWGLFNSKMERGEKKNHN